VDRGSPVSFGIDTISTILAAGLIFLLALVLGIWKYRQMATSENHLAHPYVDIAHRAALLYSFATMLVAIFEYIVHGIRRDTTNQFEHPTPALTVGMIALIIGEVGGFAVLLAGFVAGQLL
jgi:hypothetical protein